MTTQDEIDRTSNAVNEIAIPVFISHV
jgi:hypothetical protein